VVTLHRTSTAIHDLLFMIHAWPWLVLALLGAYHGLNPAMGWLFAMAIGLQEKSRAAIGRALVPIAIGHAAAIALAILVLRSMQDVFPLRTLKLIVAGILFFLGLYRIFRANHPRGAGMRVGAKDLFVWSFLMASAHGAGLMLVPVLLAQPVAGITHHMTSGLPASSVYLSASAIALAVFIHTVSLLLVAGILAFFFYETYQKFGLSLLKRTWLNFDLMWAIALIIAGLIALLM
jgi:hypothetical protein